MANITLTQLTTGTVDGVGVFDKLMQTFKAHLDQEYTKNRIRGPEYAQVYLGGLQSILDRSLQFLLSEQEADLKAQLLAEQVKNAITENTVLVAQECKLRAEFDVLMEQKLKTTSETALLNQKKVTEQAQTQATGVSADSVVGKQKALYQAQTDGYVRNAEQKAAKILVDAWAVARTTDANNTPRSITNNLDDANLGNTITKLLGGIGLADANP